MKNKLIDLLEEILDTENEIASLLMRDCDPYDEKLMMLTVKSRVLRILYNFDSQSARFKVF